MQHVGVGWRGALLLAFVGCAVKPDPLVWNPASTTDPAPRLPASYALLPRDDQPTLKAIVEGTEALIASDGFRARLRQIDALGARGETGPMSGARVDALYAGLVVDHAVLPWCFVYEPGNANETATTAPAPAPKECAPKEIHVAKATVHDLVLRWARSTVLEEQACAFNTIAHERTHAVVKTLGGDGLPPMVFLDDGHRRQANPVVSYVVGALAQCTFLASSYGVDAFDVASCVEEAGTNAFFTASCKQGWGQRFVKGAVAARCP